MVLTSIIYIFRTVSGVGFGDDRSLADYIRRSLALKRIFSYTYFRWERLTNSHLSRTCELHPLVGKMVVSCCSYGRKNRFGERHGLGFYRFLAVPEARRKKGWVMK